MARERKFSKDELFQATKHLLVSNGYEGFTISILAEFLDVARGTIYKYVENKEELITEYMLYEMNDYLADLKQMESIKGFNAQFDFLINLMFRDSEILHIIQMGQEIKEAVSNKALDNIKKLELLHMEMYSSLQHFIQLGREEKRFKSHLPDSLLLGFIFQSVSIPNHFGVPYSEWVQSIKEILRDGMFIDNN